LDKSRKYAEKLTREAFASLEIFGDQAMILNGLAGYLLGRDR
jgi:hypothetical protein